MIGLELERFLSNYFSEIPAKSIICIDQVPIRMKKPEFIIVNTSKSSDHKGRHWFVISR
jgi:hypothetical protein